MKKLFVWATMAALLVAGSALAAGPVTSLNAGRMFIQPNATFAPPATFAFTGGTAGQASGPTTTNNDDSCDISTMPAATLLLPYFEVDFRSPSNSAVNTNFTITNVSSFPQIAHITIWTDRSFPVVDFNIFLTGYDVQGISLYDIIARGQIPPTGAGTVPTSTTGPATPTCPRDDTGAATPCSPIGARSNLNNSNPNLNNGTTGAGIFSACASLAGPIPGDLLADIQSALSVGTYGTRCTPTTAAVGDNHANGFASGYVTVDVANTCSTTLPVDSNYFLNEILFDNVLIGDYQRINPVAGTSGLTGDAGGNPMVHIRAIPEGGPAAGTGVTAVNLPFTFYDRYTPAFSALTAPLGRKSDRRQPLPGVYAARYISGGTGAMDTRVNIWREGVRGGVDTLACSVTANSVIATTEVVRFDNHENPSAFVAQGCQVSPCTTPTAPTFTFSEAVSVPLSQFAAATLITGVGDVGGWLYLNLNNGGNLATSAPARIFSVAAGATGTHAGASQNWVTLTHSANSSGLGRFSVEFDAAALGNGCSGTVPVTSSVRGGSPAIGPLGGAVSGTNSTP